MAGPPRPILPEELAELEEAAKRTLNDLRREQEERTKVGHGFPSLVLEFAGCPKSGKTTTIDIVQHFFRRMEYKVRPLPEGASKRDFKFIRPNLPHYNNALLNYASQELLVAYHAEKPPDIILLDRGILDTVAWTEMLRRRQLITNREAENMRKYALDRSAALVSRLYLFVCSPEVSLDREKATKLTMVDGTAMNPAMLTLMHSIYEELGAKLQLQFSVRRIDTTEPLPERDTAYKVVRDILAHDWFVDPSSAPRA